MNVLIGCEYSATVRDEFTKRGHNAWSCDLLPSDKPGNHFQGNLLDYLDGYFPGHGCSPQPWDLLIAHPPCTHTSLSGARWCKDHWVKCKAHPDGRYWHDGSEKRRLRDESVKFFKALLNCKIPKKCIEQPMSRMSTLVGPFTQRIHPWQFGHPERKETWLWLRNLRPLRPTNPQPPFGQICMPIREDKIAQMLPSEDRGHLRSKTYEGIAKAMADQWG